MKKLIPSLILSLTALFLSLGCISAATTPQGVSVTPSIAHIDLAVDDPEYILTYTNNFKTDITLTLSAKDFTGISNNYQLEFLNQTQAENYQYSLTPWLTFETTSLNLSPGETKSIKIFINKDQITKGSHYASILAEISAPNDRKNISVKAAISSLLFVRANTGKEVENGKISSLDPLRDSFEFPQSFVLRFQNNGNVHVVPYGLLQIYDPLGQQIAQGILNENSLDALPQSIRNYTIPTSEAKSLLLPGIYTAKLNLHFGKTNRKLSFQTKFFSQGSLGPATLAGLIIILGVIIFVYKKKFKKSKNKSSKS